MKKIICLLIICCILTTGVPVFANAEEELAENETEIADASVLEGCHSIDARRAILGELPLITNCTAAFMFEYNTDTLMYSFNGDNRIIPASFVKIMTALLAIQKGNLSDQVTVNAASYVSLPHDAATTDFKDGEILTLEDLLNCMMVGSGNDAAITIAEHISGSQAAFVEDMNNYAKELGCKDTNFTNVHGIYDSNQYSTCRDITRIIDKAMEYESFRKIFGAVHYTVPKTNKTDELRVLKTGNFHLTQDENETHYDGRVTGGRTGVGLNDERCIASTASKDGLDMICIVVGSKTVYEDNNYTALKFGGYREVSDLLDYGFDGFKSVQILHEGQIMKQIEVENGECNLTIGSKKSLSTIIPKDIYLDDLNFVYSDTATTHNAPIKKDQYISTVRISYGNLCLAEAELYAMNSVKTVQDSYKIVETKTKSNSFWTWTLIIIIAVIVVIVVILVWPRIRRRMVRRGNRMRNYYTGGKKRK